MPRIFISAPCLVSANIVLALQVRCQWKLRRGAWLGFWEVEVVAESGRRHQFVGFFSDLLWLRSPQALQNLRVSLQVSGI